MMLVRSYPDFFGTYKIYEIIESVLEKNMRKRDIELLLNDLEIICKMTMSLIKKLNTN